LADRSANPEFIASDLLSQAEHGTDSQVILVTDSEKTIADVQKELKIQLGLLQRKAFAAKSLENSRIILLKNLPEMISLINEYAPEHLIIATKNPMKQQKK